MDIMAKLVTQELLAKLVKPAQQGLKETQDLEEAQETQDLEETPEAQEAWVL